MTTRMPSAAAIVAALVFAASVFAFTLFVWRTFGGSTPFEPRGYRVSAAFGPGGSQLVENADVRIAGISVGKVKLVRPRGERTDVQLELDAHYAPIARDARAIVRTKTLLGETFVALTPGSATAPRVPDGGRLPASQVEEAQGADDVLSTFDPATRRAFREVFAELAASLHRRGPSLSATIGELAPATERLRALSTTLARRERDLAVIVDDTGDVLDATARRDGALRRLVQAGERAFSATAASARDVEATTRALDAVLRAAQPALGEARDAATEAAPVLRALRPAVPAVRPALAGAERVLPVAARVAQRTVPVVDAAERGLPAADALLQPVPAAARVLNRVGRDAVPVLQTLASYGDDAIPATAKAASALQGTIDGQHVLRVAFLLFNESFYGQPRRAPTSRSFAYRPPGGLRDLLAGRPLAALDCTNTKNALLVPAIGPGPPPCRELGPWTLLGKTARFPGVERAK